MSVQLARGGRCGAAAVVIGMVCAALVPGAAEAAKPNGGQVQLPTTVADFYQPGTQPNEGGLAPIVTSGSCTFCHATYLDPPEQYHEPWDGWTNSAMAQSARDPIWRAALAIANQDAANSGEYCIRCHAPRAWLSGRSMPSDGSALEFDDLDGINCQFCHRLVNPVIEPDSPAQDEVVLGLLGDGPGAGRGNARYVVDFADVRRGPFDDVPQNVHGVPIIYSPFHRRSELCGTCHDVGNPAYMRQSDGSYALVDAASGHDIGVPHGTQDPYDMFPEQRTYSEWASSAFSAGGVLFEDGRFGGNHPTGVMEECQDCHMPDRMTGGCAFWEFPPFFARPDVPEHTFAGANTWVLKAVRALYDDGDTGLSPESVDDAVARNSNMLRAASDVQVARAGSTIEVRVINWSGHKLPTGYPEGRRMWINVKFLDEQDEIIAERGHYDFATATLDEAETKVYQMLVGISPDVATMVNLPAGQSNRLVLVNEILSDNRIPPVGFTNAAYAAFDGDPVGAAYADGQHWDDTAFGIPAGAVKAVVTLYYQVMTREYAEFLRDANKGGPGNDGEILHGLYEDAAIGNLVPPVDMDVVEIDLSGPVGDVTGDGMVGFADLLQVLSNWGPCPPPDLCPADLNGDGSIGFSDLLLVLSNWTG
jgi:hypothetical protein